MGRPLKNPVVRDELLADGTMVLFHEASRELVTLNPTGAAVWDHCDGSLTDDQIASQIRALFLEAPHVEAEVGRFLQKLRSRGVLLDQP